jgi:hypothetical protein
MRVGFVSRVTTWRGARRRDPKGILGDLGGVLGGLVRVMLVVDEDRVLVDVLVDVLADVL